MSEIPVAASLHPHQLQLPWPDRFPRQSHEVPHRPQLHDGDAFEQWWAEQKTASYHEGLKTHEWQRHWEREMPVVRHLHDSSLIADHSYPVLAKLLVGMLGGLDHIVLLGLGSAFEHQGTPEKRWPRGNSVDRSSAQVQMFSLLVEALRQTHPKATVRSFERHATLGDVVLSDHYGIPLEHKFEGKTLHMKDATTVNMLQQGHTLILGPDLPREFSAVIDVAAAELIQAGKHCEVLLWGSARVEKFYESLNAKIPRLLDSYTAKGREAANALQEVYRVPKAALDHKGHAQGPWSTYSDAFKAEDLELLGFRKEYFLFERLQILRTLQNAYKLIPQNMTREHFNIQGYRTKWKLHNEQEYAKAQDIDTQQVFTKMGQITDSYFTHYRV